MMQLFYNCHVMMFKNLIWAANFLILQKLPDCFSSYKWPGSEVGGRPTAKSAYAHADFVFVVTVTVARKSP